MSHTYVLLDVPQDFFDYVAARLREAEYHQAFHAQGGQMVLDMHGIALVAQAEPVRSTQHNAGDQSI